MASRCFHLVNIPFGEALDQMPVYAKFMKVLLTGRIKPKDDENIALSENCCAILQKKLPPKLKNPGAFIIPCSIGPVDIGRALCDLGASINLMPLSMMKKLGCGEPKPKRMTLTLAYRKLKNPKCYRVDVVEEILEDNSREPQPTHPTERAIVNSIESCEHNEDLEGKECVKQLEASKQELEPVKIEEILGENSMGAPTLSAEGEKNPK
ncbi:hypothetical protein MTR_0042s0100 [Medicago truncatula]|uniref:Gag-asp_proteas domain-containing protein n=1 Tax=Medicago truncatula TaxID=3880 RepID=A0A072THS3_MEDTR|nr:hypothetical protein MTR_0042s0100 [Medicago truncatula]